jgi:hypothetical protein
MDVRAGEARRMPPGKRHRQGPNRQRQAGPLGMADIGPACGEQGQGFDAPAKPLGMCGNHDSRIGGMRARVHRRDEDRFGIGGQFGRVPEGSSAHRRPEAAPEQQRDK